MKQYRLIIMVILAVAAVHADPQFAVKGELLYMNALSRPSLVENWVMEGPGQLEFKDGWMHMFSPDEAYHHVFWCPYNFPDYFIAEWQAQNMEPDAGLCIIFFAAKGLNGEDILTGGLPERDGTFGNYIRGPLNCYHISYYANTPKKPDRGDSHLRKNKGFHLVQPGQEGIPTESTDIHTMQLVKNGAHIVMYVDDRKIIEWVDPENKYGPPLKDGKIGFRQMQWTHFRYRNFKVWSIKD